MWSNYFTRSNIYGLDVVTHPLVLYNIEKLPRLKLIIDDAYQAFTPLKYRLERETMDIVIDDGLHERWNQEKALHMWWKTVKLGGYYIIEDIESFAVVGKNMTL